MGRSGRREGRERELIKLSPLGRRGWRKGRGRGMKVRRGVKEINGGWHEF